MSEAELTLWESHEEPPKAGAESIRVVWRLFSPSFRLLVCGITKAPRGFELRVTCGGRVMATCRAPRLELLHERATEWRIELGRQGYVPADSVRMSEPRTAATGSEARAAFIGIVECAAILALEQPAAGRALRDRATEGLVAVGLSDGELIRQAIVAVRCVLRLASELDRNQDLLQSCNSLLERIEATLSLPSKEA